MTTSIAALSACAQTIVLEEVRVPPRLPYAVAAGIKAAVDASNRRPGGAPRWRIMGAHEATGWIVEHYRIGRLDVLLSLDPSASSFAHQIWVDVRHLDPAQAAGLASGLADTPGPALRSVEQAGLRARSGVSPELLYFELSGAAEIEGAVGIATRRQAERLRERPRAGRSSVSWRSVVDRAMRRALRDALGLEAVAPAPTLAGERIVVVVVGAVDRSSVLDALREGYVDVEPHPAPKSGPRANAPAFPIEIDTAGDDRELHLGWPIDPSDHTAALALEATAHVLAQDSKSLLDRRLRGSASAIRARAPEGSTTFDIMLVLDPSATPTAAATLVRLELDAIADGDTTGRDLERARARMMDETLERASGLESRGELFATALLFGGGLDAIDLRLAALEALDEPQIRNACDRWLADRAPFQILGKPKEGP